MSPLPPKRELRRIRCPEQAADIRRHPRLRRAGLCTARFARSLRDSPPAPLPPLVQLEGAAFGRKLFVRWGSGSAKTESTAGDRAELARCRNPGCASVSLHPSPCGIVSPSGPRARRARVKGSGGTKAEGENSEC